MGDTKSPALSGPHTSQAERDPINLILENSYNKIGGQNVNLLFLNVSLLSKNTCDGTMLLGANPNMPLAPH